ncbi:alpha/beta hydrolase [Pseudoalteromonas luteoviolacea]|uniref:alpha/beta hydrolase n=1 Tax=Pseudoalteromonas luteoviolacea TaxID=43657 RepID=UPI001F39E133|nr:alpha/beta hydrolase [Pseudoalteromonas luteoviolacea]MCF6442927.1 alpha/beta hydrolase [Pseudoalteromonas luteoviolacea]
MFIFRLLGSICAIALLYVLMVFIGLRFFLDELVFVTSPDDLTNESFSFKVSEGKSEALVRVYQTKNAGHCVIFFLGRSGGIQRYEKEIFGYLLESGTNIYAISFPGYDGAAGRSTFSNVKELGNSALVHINKAGSCRLQESVFLGRSLGGAIAVELAVKNPPAGILVDSVAPSLAIAFRAKFKKSWFTTPAAYLPLEVFMAANPSFDQAISKFSSRVVVLQGSHDLVASYEEIKGAIGTSQNVSVKEVKGATHSNTHIVGRNLYLKELDSLFKRVQLQGPELKTK